MSSSCELTLWADSFGWFQKSNCLLLGSRWICFPSAMRVSLFLPFYLFQMSTVARSCFQHAPVNSRMCLGVPWPECHWISPTPSWRIYNGVQSPAPHQKQSSSFEGNSKPSELLLLLLYHSLFSLQSAFYPFTFCSFLHLMMIMLCPSTLFRYLCTFWNNRSPYPRSTCVSLSGNREGGSEGWECFCPPTSTSTIYQVTGLGLAARRCSSPSLCLNLGQLGRELSLLETKENTWRGAQGSHGAQLKHRGPASQAAAPSHTANAG